MKRLFLALTLITGCAMTQTALAQNGQLQRAILGIEQTATGKVAYIWTTKGKQSVFSTPQQLCDKLYKSSRPDCSSRRKMLGFLEDRGWEPDVMSLMKWNTTSVEADGTTYHRMLLKNLSE